MTRGHIFRFARCLAPCLLGGLSLGVARAADPLTIDVQSQSRPPIASSNRWYPSNRAPLVTRPFARLTVGSITPKGWLRKQLELEADGMAGHLEELSPWCKFAGNAWTDPQGKGHSGWEELPYWLKGYGDLGYVLRDERITHGAKRWIDAILASQRPDGFFGPEALRTALDGKPDTWPHNPILSAMRSWQEFSGDERVIPFMTRWFRWQNALPAAQLRGGWGELRYSDYLDSVVWLYNRTGDAWLLDLARKMHENSADYTHGIPNWHNVNIAQGFREPAEFGEIAKDPNFLAATERDYATVMQLYGQMPGGGFAGDENCRPAFRDPRQGFETCGIVEFMHSFEDLVRISGNPIWANRAEDLAFNSLPAALTPDLKALHYLTSPNAVQLDKENHHPDIDDSGTMISYSPYEVYRCCQHNHTMGWPYYAEELWLATADNGLCASLYAASEVDAKVGADGVKVKLVETTDYPFEDSVELKVVADQPVRFPIYLRVPGWCEKPTVQVNGKDVTVAVDKGGYIAIDRAWSNEDHITLRLPMNVRVRTWERNKNAVSVNYGPLTFSLAIGQKWDRYGGSDAWPEHEVHPTTPWNYGLVLEPGNPAASFQVIRKRVVGTEQPFTPEHAPIELKTTARRIPGWTIDKLGMVGTLQPSPIRSSEPTEQITLIPMGAARLRISAFPTIGSGPNSTDWAAPAAAPVQASASHVFESDSVDALNDGILPASSGDQTVPRFTWWDHKGGVEWVQYDFKSPRNLSGVEVYWLDDTGKGECRVPQSWRLLYRDGGEWKPVANLSGLGGITLDQFNRALFKPVQTTSLRLEAQLQPGFSGGILEWRVLEAEVKP